MCLLQIRINCVRNVKMIVSNYISRVQYAPDFGNTEKGKLISNSQWDILLHSLHSFTRNEQA